MFSCSLKLVLNDLDFMFYTEELRGQTQTTPEHLNSKGMTLIYNKCTRQHLLQKGMEDKRAPMHKVVELEANSVLHDIPHTSCVNPCM